MYLLCGCMKFSLIFSLIGVVIGGFRWLRVVNIVQKSTEYGGKMPTLVKESCNSPEFESLILCQKPHHLVWLFFLPSDLGEIRTHLDAARTSAAGEGWTEPHIASIESLILCQKSHHLVWLFYAQLTI